MVRECDEASTDASADDRGREERGGREEAEREQEEREVAVRNTEWEGKSKDDIILDAYDLSRGSLAATLKRARMLTHNKITMDDVRKWHLENTNNEKKTNR